MALAVSSTQETRQVALNASGGCRDHDREAVLLKPSHSPEGQRYACEIPRV
jgi:hypothetical protein